MPFILQIEVDLPCPLTKNSPYWWFLIRPDLLVVWLVVAVSYWKYPSLVLIFPTLILRTFRSSSSDSASTFLDFLPASVCPMPFQPLPLMQYLHVLLVSSFFLLASVSTSQGLPRCLLASSLSVVVGHIGLIFRWYRHNFLFTFDVLYRLEKNEGRESRRNSTLAFSPLAISWSDFPNPSSLVRFNLVVIAVKAFHALP